MSPHCSFKPGGDQGCSPESAFCVCQLCLKSIHHCWLLPAFPACCSLQAAASAKRRTIQGSPIPVLRGGLPEGSGEGKLAPWHCLFSQFCPVTQAGCGQHVGTGGFRMDQILEPSSVLLPHPALPTSLSDCSDTSPGSLPGGEGVPAADASSQRFLGHLGNTSGHFPSPVPDRFQTSCTASLQTWPGCRRSNMCSCTNPKG